MSTLAARPGDDVVLPAGVSEAALFADAWHSAWRTERDYRRWATRMSPPLFAYTYLVDHLSSAETGGVTSLARHHIDMAAAAVQWVRPGAHRDAWVVARGGAKTTWQTLILPLWAAAHGHRGFALLFGDAERQAVQHLGDVRAELAGNALLRYDYPELVPRRGRNTATEVVTEGGQAFAARGMDSKVLGPKVGSARPDLLIADDIEPDAGHYSAPAKVKRMATFLNAILPMNEQAAVSLVGTVTMHGSIMHDVVRRELGEDDAAPWLADARMTGHYYPAITTGPDGAEASYWEARHSLEYLRSISHTADYALNYLGRPLAAGGRLWRADTFRYLPRPVPIEARIISVDVAVSGASNKDRHDYTAVAVLGHPVGRRTEVIVEYAKAWRMTGAQLLAKLHELCGLNSDIRTVIVEVNQGQELWREILDPMPAGVELVLYRSHLPKDYRLTRCLDHYERERVWHTTRLVEYEAQAVAWPDVEHDDLLDAVAAGVERLLPAA